MLKYAFVLIFSDCLCINFVDQLLDAQLMQIVGDRRAEKSNLIKFILFNTVILTLA